MGDFRGYNHQAVSPFQPLYLDYNAPGVEDYIEPQYQLVAVNLSKDAPAQSNNYNANAEINPKDMGEFNSGEYVILWRKKGTHNTSASTPTALTQFTVDTGRITGSTSVTGTFESCLAIHRRGGNGAYYPCDGTYRTFEVRTQTKEEYIGLYLTNQCRLNVRSTIGDLTVQMTLTNITDTAIETKVYCLVKGTHQDNIWQSANISTTQQTFTVPAHGSLTIYGTENQTFSTEPQGTIRVEDITHYGSPITADCRARNTLHGVITVTKEKTIYTA